jgi:hypothetical protein
VLGNVITFTTIPIVGDVAQIRFLAGNVLDVNYSNANVAAFLPTYSGNVSANFFIGNLVTTGNISTTGNITTGNIGITGGSLTWSNASIVQTSASDVSITGDGQVTVRSLDGTYQWTFDSNGNLTAPGNVNTTGNVTGNFFIGNGSQLTGIAGGTGNTGNITFNNTTITSNVANANVTLQGNGTGNVNLASSVSVTGNITADYYYGNGYYLTGLPFTTITNQTLTGNNVATTFVLNRDATADGILVTINGISQTPTVDYTVSGNALTFTSAPYTGDVMQVRFLAGNIVSGNGNANTGNVTFNDINIIGTGNLNLQPNGSASEYLNIYLTGAADIHVAYGGGSGNVILGTDEEANIAVLLDGNVAIQAGNVAGTKTWTFDTAGNLTLPLGSIVYETNIPDQSLSGSAIALKPIGGTTANQQLLIYPTAFDGDHIHLTSGNLLSTELYLGNDDFYVKLANTGNIIVNTSGNSAQWTLDTTGNLTTPSNLVIGPGPGSGSRIFQYDEGLEIVGEGANSVVQLGWTANTSAPDSVTTIAMNYPGGGEGNILIAVGNNATTVNYWLFDNTGTLTLPAVNDNRQQVQGTQQTILGDPFPTSAVGNVNVTVWTADSAAVSAAKMTMRTQYGNTGTPVLNIEIMDIMMAKTYPNGTPVFTVSNRVKTNPAYADTLVDVTLAAGNVLQVTSSGPSAVGVVYWTYSVTAFNQT